MAATVADMLSFFDRNTIADLLSDTGTPAEDLPSNAVLLQLLSAARGEVELSLTVAEQYSSADLDGLTGYAADVEKKLECTICLGNLLTRRPGSDHEEVFESHIEWAQDILEKLRLGQRVFGGAVAQQAAGLVSVVGPSSFDTDRLHLITRHTNFFPHRRPYTP
jgi:hypothetical protein